MVPKEDLPDTSPEPFAPSSPTEGGTSEPAPEPIVIPPFEIVTYSEPDPETAVNIDIEIKTGWD